MKLHHNPASPFVRMVCMTAHELGIAEEMELIHTGTFLPIAEHEAVARDNPLGKIPALVTAHGHQLHDSRVICKYLVHHAGDKSLLPDEPVARFRILTLQSIAIGIADSGVSLRYETFLRPEQLRWPEWIDRQTSRINSTLDGLEADWTEDLAEVTLGSIAVAAVLGYLDFRWPDWGWRDGRSNLASFYEGFSQRPSMMETIPE